MAPSSGKREMKQREMKQHEMKQREKDKRDQKKALITKKHRTVPS
jgi:hypothetical protein